MNTRKIVALKIQIALDHSELDNFDHPFYPASDQISADLTVFEKLPVNHIETVVKGMENLMQKDMVYMKLNLLGLPLCVESLESVILGHSSFYYRFITVGERERVYTRFRRIPQDESVLILRQVYPEIFSKIEEKNIQKVCI